MTFNPKAPTLDCPICGNAANVQTYDSQVRVDCCRCGYFSATRDLIDDWLASSANNSGWERAQAIASHFIRRLQGGAHRTILDRSFFQSIGERNLPTPAEAADNLVLFIGDLVGRSPGKPETINFHDLSVVAEIGAANEQDLRWLVSELKKRGDLVPYDASSSSSSIQLTLVGWGRFEDLQKKRIESKYAFFARKFENSELDSIIGGLESAVRQTGFELRIVSQKAGLIDSIIEHEIRGARFLISDLSDNNAGAYWEAGFAEGLGKPVIYICRDGKQTHFDTEHRHTIRWNPDQPERAANLLKAVIRNTLLGDAKQSDD